MNARAEARGRRVYAMARPSPIAARQRPDLAALSKPDAFDRWSAGLRAEGSAGANVITVFDVIGEDFWSGGGVTVKRVDAALRSIGADKDVEIHINSPGGDMFEGIAIYNRLLQHRGKVTVKVLGLAASAASIIAMAGEERLISRAAFLMIHNCWILAVGDRNELAEAAEWLAPFDDAMAAVYAEASGRTTKEMAAAMDSETWLNGAQAVERGLATGLLGDDVTEDAAETEKAQGFNAVRQAEIGLCKSMSRGQARELLAKIKGTPGAAPADPTPGAGDPELAAALGGLLNTIKSNTKS